MCMFSTPKNGWVDITIGNWSDRASYLTNPHLDFLDAFVDILTTKVTTSVFCDAEGWIYNVVLNDYIVYIVTDKEDVSVCSCDVNMHKLVREACDDISRDIDAWSMWSYLDDTPERVSKARAKIRRKLKKVYDLLEASKGNGY